ncbi:MAG: PIG-L family deacetylase [Caldilineaceae bacterium]|nr:PIG-L family deacetylase [Caldilineaceae bacterium]
MQPFYDAIYLSPHLDDVTLSCGGQIFQQTQAGQRILVVTITAGDPPQAAVSGYAQSLHDRWELVTDAVAARRAEDYTANQILGADTLHWTVPDCIYRYHPESGAALYRSDPDIFGELHPTERPLVATLSEQIAALPAHARLYVPLTIGHHVDHQLTRLAAERAFAPTTLWYYEDYPYAQKPGALAQVIPTNNLHWQPTVIPLVEAAIAAKIAAIAAFVSQFSTFFTDHADLESQIRTFTTQVGGERVWRQ